MQNPSWLTALTLTTTSILWMSWSTQAFVSPGVASISGWTSVPLSQSKHLSIRQALPQHVTSFSQQGSFGTRSLQQQNLPKTVLRLANTKDTATTTEENQDIDSEIERLRSMAAKLRAEAATLEAQQAQEFAEAAERAFRKFDTDADGQVGFSELKIGLEKVLKEELPEARVRKLLEKFDTSKDGSLQLEEFVSVDRLRNQLDAIRREERQASIDAAKVAQLEEEAAKFALARLEVLNDRSPSTTDKLLSVLPYLFPLLDGLQFGRFLFMENSDNPIVPIVALLFQLYRSIPFGGFIAFFALSFLSNFPSINRLIRFNMQQAIYFDIALFFPGLIGSLYTLVFSDLMGAPIPQGIGELSSDVIFATLLVAIAYSTVSSLLGITPDKVPFISQAANSRMPTMDMFDDQGRFVPREMRQKKEDSEKPSEEKHDGEDEPK